MRSLNGTIQNVSPTSSFNKTPYFFGLMDECVCIQMTALSVGYIQTYRDSVDSLGESVDMSIKVQTYKVIFISPRQFSFVLKRVGEHSVQPSAVVLYSLVISFGSIFLSARLMFRLPQGMYTLMARCEELDRSMQPIHTLAAQIRDVKRTLDALEALCK